MEAIYLGVVGSCEIEFGLQRDVQIRAITWKQILR